MKTEVTLKRLSETFYPGLICASAIMVLIGLPGKYFPTVVSFWDWISPDKVVHLIMFASLSLISLWGYRKILYNENPYRKKIFWIIASSTIAYGGLTELLQKYLFVNRYCSIFDFIANTIGCVIGIIIFIFICQKKIKK